MATRKKTRRPAGRTLTLYVSDENRAMVERLRKKLAAESVSITDFVMSAIRSAKP